MERVNFYIDGFNFYYGLKNKKKLDSDWQKFYWLNYVNLFQQFLGENQMLQKVIYFAAQPPLDDQARQRQSLLFRANRILNPDRFELVMGQFIQKKITCKVCRQDFNVYEEKQTDVNIAVRLVVDCALDNADTVVLVSADSDIVPPLQSIKQHFPQKNVRVCFPPSYNCRKLDYFMKTVFKKPAIHLERSKPKFSNSIMPDVVTVDGKTCTIPQKWKI